MPAYPLSEIKEHFPKDGETITVEIHYHNWIVDSQRIALEQSVENYFSEWLGSVLQLGEREASEIIGEGDYADFMHGIDQIAAEIPPDLLPSLSSVKPVFLLTEVVAGSVKGKRKIGLVPIITSLAMTIPGGTIGGVASGLILDWLRAPVQPHVRTINGSLVCTKQTGKSLIHSLDISSREEIEATRIEIRPRIDAAADDLLSKVAQFPDEKCTLVVTASDPDGTVVGYYKLSKMDAEKALRQKSTKRLKIRRNRR